jgi:hypothetical protein
MFDLFTFRASRLPVLLALLCCLSPAAWAQLTTTESFETGTKTAYPTSPVVLGSGSWTFDDALLGTDAQDHKAGAQAARLQQAGTADHGVLPARRGQHRHGAARRLRHGCHLGL